MKTDTAIIIFFVIMCVATFAIYEGIVMINQNKQRQSLEQVCSALTDELNKNINETSLYTSYYCYYKPYAPPEGMEETTTTMCVCEGKTVNGTTVTIQVLGAKG